MAKNPDGPTYPVSHQVSLTRATDEAVKAAAQKAATDRGLSRVSVSLIIREAVEKIHGGAATATERRTQA